MPFAVRRTRSQPQGASTNRPFEGTRGPGDQAHAVPTQISFAPRRRGRAYRLAIVASAGLAILSLAFQPSEAQAVYVAYSRIDLLASQATPTSLNDLAFNSVDLTGTGFNETIGGPFDQARGFIELAPSMSGPSLSAPSVVIRSSVRADEFTTGAGLQAAAGVNAGWTDLLRFTPIAAEAAQIAYFSVVLDLHGTMSLTPSFNGTTQLELVATWGPGSDYLDPRLFSDSVFVPGALPKSRTIDHKRLEVSSAGVDPFGSSGIGLQIEYHVVAYSSGEVPFEPPYFASNAQADFVASMLGIRAYDAGGNLLPDAHQWVAVTSDSGVNYGVFGSFAAVPEPSSLILLGSGAAASLAWARRGSRRRAG